MILSTKIAQMASLCRTKEPPELYIRNVFKMASPPDPLVQIHNDFTKLFLMMHHTKMAQKTTQMVPIY